MKMTLRQRFLTGLCLAGLLAGCAQSSESVTVYDYSGHEKGAGSLGLHTIKQGETLWMIAKSYQVSLRDLLQVNHLVAPYRVAAGDRLLIPAPATYHAKAGDTLYKISRVFDTSTYELAQINQLQAPFVLTGGQVLKLPSRAVTTPQRAPEIAGRQIELATSVAPKIPNIPKNNQVIEREVLGSLPQPKIQEQQKYTAPVVAEIPDEPVVAGHGFIKPVSGKIISAFGPKADGLHNDGINIKASRGDAVRSAESGVVAYTGSQIEGYGNMVLIRHANGYLTAYAHLEKSLVKKGDRVKRGQTIGTVGTTGNVKEPQLHFEIRKGREAVNPASIMRI